MKDMNSEIEKSIIKFLTKEANLEELRALELWISNPKNEALFLEYIKANAFANRAFKVYDKDQAKRVITFRIKQKRGKTKGYGLIKYAAAILIGFVCVSYFFKDHWFNSPAESTPSTVNTKTSIVPGTDKATLTLDDGSVVALEKGATLQTQNASSNGEQIVYTPKEDKEKPKDIAYNYLTIPRGGQYHVVLSDGTEVWLNSESKLKYPVEFIEDSPREVELVYGEAYFDVSHSSKHNGAKFKVINHGQDIEVLGTEFNIKAYHDETNIYTTLVEGSVAINFKAQRKTLKPDQQSNVNPQSDTIDIYAVDANAEVSWRYGLFTFKGKSLKKIMKVLSRWYDVDVVFMDKSMESIKFRGVLSKSQSIEEILSIIKSNSINNYKIQGKTVILE